MGRVAVALFVSLFAGTEAVRSSGLLCIGTTAVTVRSGSAQCQADGDRVAITPADTTRSFARADYGGRRILLGELPARATSLVPPGTQPPVRLPLSVMTSEPIDRTCDLAISPLDDAGTSSSGDTPKWTIEIPGKDLRSRRELTFPRGHYRIAVDCGSEFSAEPLIVDARQGGDEILPAVQLNVVALPRISGRITPAESTASALLQDEDGRLLGRPEPDGSFRIVVDPERWPRRVVVSASGYGSVVVPLPPAPATMEVPDVELKKAGRVILAIPPAQLKALESVEVFQLRGKRERSPYRTMSKAALPDSELIVEVAPGEYLFVLQGAQPLERFGATLEVGAGEELQLPVSLDDQEVDLRTFFGDRSLGNAKVLIESVPALWNTTLHTSAEGAFASRVWQPGEVVFILQSAENIGHSGTLELRGPRVEIRVPTRTVEGKVVDALTGEPLADVNVAMDGRAGGTMTKTGADGTFKFIGVKPGSYRISAGGANGLSHATVPVRIAEEVSVERVRLALRRQQELELEITAADGRPVRGAAVFELSGPAVLSLRETDDAGMVRVPASSTAPRSVIVIAPDGVLYAEPLAPERRALKRRVAIPPPNSSITISVGAQAGRQPIPGVSLVMRLNGVLFPADAMHIMFERSGIRLTSDGNGLIRLSRVPVGLYEFWPIRSRSDLEAILTDRPPAAPVVIAAGPGENRATLGFTAARSQ